MKYKLYHNMKRLTTGFSIGILCVTLSVLGLRFTVFSDMAAAPESAVTNQRGGEEKGYQINGVVYFSDATAKGDVFISNLSADHMIMVDITLVDTGDSILSSGIISPGSSRNSQQMNPDGQKLAEGVYQCIAEITARDPNDSKTIIGKATEEIEIYIGVKPEKSK